MTGTTCSALEDPRELWQTRICLAAVSKDVRGDLRLLERDVQDCEDRECRTLKTDHMLKVEVSAHQPCDSDVARELDGVLYVRRLVTAFADGSGQNRGPHAGAFVWVGAGARVSGTLAGMTNVGTHREPAFDACQECHAPGYMEGRLCGAIVRAADPRLVGCTVTASYRFRFDASEEAQDTALAGTIEGVVVAACSKLDCLQLSGFPTMAHTNPWTVSGHTFQVLDHTGSPTATADVVTWGGVTGLNASFQTRISLAAPVTAVDITLAHFSTPATVTALDGAGNTVDTDTMSVAGGTPQTLHLDGGLIESLVVDAPANETLILELCTGA
jgi:hypothetical protein